MLETYKLIKESEKILTIKLIMFNYGISFLVTRYFNIIFLLYFNRFFSGILIIVAHDHMIT